METLVLALMRQHGSVTPKSTLTALSDLCAELAAGAAGRGITLWRLAAAFAEAEAAGLLPQGDVHTKRVAARLLAQLRLSWWREQLAGDAAAWPEGEPLLDAVDLVAGYIPGVNILNGKVAYKQVADDLGLPYEPFKV